MLRYHYVVEDLRLVAVIFMKRGGTNSGEEPTNKDREGF